MQRIKLYTLEEYALAIQSPCSVARPLRLSVLSSRIPQVRPARWVSPQELILSMCSRRPSAMPACRRSYFSLADLNNKPLLSADDMRAHPALHQWLLERCSAAGFRPAFVEAVASAQEAFDLVQEGVGIALLPQSICRSGFQDICSMPIRDLEPIELVLAYRGDSPPLAQRILPTRAPVLFEASGKCLLLLTVLEFRQQEGMADADLLPVEGFDHNGRKLGQLETSSSIRRTLARLCGKGLRRGSCEEDQSNSQGHPQHTLEKPPQPPRYPLRPILRGKAWRRAPCPQDGGHLLDSAELAAGHDYEPRQTHVLLDYP